MMDKKKCKVCLGEYPIEFFPKSRELGQRVYLKSVCFGCRQTKKDEVKAKNRWSAKARNALQRHARKIDMDFKEFCQEYGHDVKEWAHKFEHAYKNGCPDCGRMFTEMGHGPQDATLDQYDPNARPLFNNFKIICATCNKEKQRTPPEEWGAKRVGWKLWHQWQAKIKEILYLGLPLLEGIKAKGNDERCCN